jgi:hypothetical protein
MILGTERWLSAVAMSVSMDNSKAGSEGTGGFYVLMNVYRIHIGSFEGAI